MVKVTVYSTDTCPWCHKAKDFLVQHKVKFVDKNVAEDDAARDEMVEKTGQMGVPVIIIEGHEPIVGFDAEAIKSALKL
jgi:glutaredoxin 3